MDTAAPDALPNRTRRNLIANLVGKGWAALIGLAFIPLYARKLGMEAYGLITIYVLLQSLFDLLDMGFSATMNREMARLSTRREERQEARDLVRTLELIYWPVGLLIGATVWAASGWIAHDWVRASHLSPAVVRQAIVMMGGVIALQWPLSFYMGGLLGLQRQVLGNLLTTVAATVRNVGAALIVTQVSATVQAFFGWQMLVNAMLTAATAACLWLCLPPGTRPARFHALLLRRVGKFASGMMAIAGVSLLLVQADKLVLSRLLPLAELGYYGLAATIASGLSVLVVSIDSTLFPRFSGLVALGDDGGLTRLYHRGCQLMSVVVLPAAITIALFSHDVMRLWTNDPERVNHTYRLVSLIVIGAALNALIHLPYAVQLAYGWTSLTLAINTVAIILLLPLLWWTVNRYGAIGAPLVWIVLNAAYVVFDVQIMHRRLLKGEMRAWYVRDVGLPLVSAVAVGFLCRLLLHDGPTLPLAFLNLIGAGAATYAAAACAAPASSGLLKSLFGKVRTRAIIRLAR